MSSKGTFQDRLFKTLKHGDELIIRCHDDGDSGHYAVRVESDTAQFGRLGVDEFMPMNKATPGQLITAIEKAKKSITTAVQMMTDAQASDGE